MKTRTCCRFGAMLASTWPALGIAHGGLPAAGAEGGLEQVPVWLAQALFVLAWMTYTRGARCTSVVGSEYFGVVTSKKGKVFGLRLHATVTVDQLIDDWCVAPAAYLDPKVLEELVRARRDLVLIGDKLFNDADLEDRLWRKRRIQLLPLRKDHQKVQWPDGVQQALGRVRHRIETVFSALTTVFNIQRPRGRSLAGHVVRIATCILAHTLSFFMA